MSSTSQQACIVGIGQTEFSKASGRSRRPPAPTCSPTHLPSLAMLDMPLRRQLQEPMPTLMGAVAEATKIRAGR